VVNVLDRHKGVGAVASAYTHIAVFLMGAIALVVPTGYSLGPALLLLASPVLLVLRPGLDLNRQDKAIIAILLAYFVVAAARALVDGQGSSGLDKPSRFLLAVPVLFWLVAYPSRLSVMWSGIAIGAIASGSWAVWQKLIEGVARAGGYTHVIQYGDLNMLFGVLCLAGLGWAFTQRNARYWVPLLALGALMGVTGSLMSGSRGGWIGFPFVLWVLYRGYARYFARRWLVGLGVLVVAIGVTVYAVPQFGVQSRVNAAFSNVQQYLKEGNTRTSLGARFAMWHAAVELIPEKPIFGWGDRGYEQARDRLVAEGRADPVIKNWGHVHNEYLDAWLKRGIFGLLALLALYLVPMRLFGKRLSSDDLALKSIAMAGMLLPVTYMDFGLSQVFLAHNSGVMVYPFWLVLLWGLLKHHEAHLASGMQPRER
jgi:O-antigen ligase